jgi:hypothetical protein
MIQRIQSVWLLVAGLLTLLTFKLAFWTTTWKDASTTKMYSNSSGSLLMYIAVIALIVLSFGTIFLFKKRPLQMQLAWLGILLSIGLFILEIKEAEDIRDNPNYQFGNWNLGIILPLLAMAFFFAAWKAMRKDHKLVKSLNRLR